MNQGEGMAISRQTVLNFRLFDPNALLALASDLSLSLTLHDLLTLRDHYREKEYRDPLVGELQFFSELSCLWQRSPHSAEVATVTGDAEQLRVWRDILRMRRDLRAAPATLDTLMGTATDYLARCGVLPYHDTLCCGDAAEFSALCTANGATSPTLRLGAVAAACCKGKQTPPAYANMLVLLNPTGNEPFDTEIADFLQRHRSLPLTPMAVTETEGVLPYLLSLGRGFFLDLLPFVSPEECSAATAFAVGRGALLFATTEEGLRRLYACGEHVIACGMLSALPCVRIRRGQNLYLSVSTELFAKLREIRSTPLTLPALREEQQGLSLTGAGTTLLGGVAAKNGCTKSLLALIGEMLHKGADPDRMTLTAALELPPLDASNAVLANALPTITELHRIVAELALPCRAPHTVLRADATPPLLTVFACAERQFPRTEGFLTAWQEAATRRDYATLRRLMRPE